MADLTPITPMFEKIFASEANRAEITVDDWINGWVSIVHGNNGIPTAQQFNLFGFILDSKINMLNTKIDNKKDGMKVYTAFMQVDATFSEDTSLVSLIRTMEPRSILYAKVTKDTTRYPIETGTVRIEKYDTDTAALMFDGIENGVPTKYFSVVTPANIETIFGGVS